MIIPWGTSSKKPRQWRDKGTQKKQATLACFFHFTHVLTALINRHYRVNNYYLSADPHRHHQDLLLFLKVDPLGA